MDKRDVLARRYQVWEARDPHICYSRVHRVGRYFTPDLYWSLCNPACFPDHHALTRVQQDVLHEYEVGDGKLTSQVKKIYQTLASKPKQVAIRFLAYALSKLWPRLFEHFKIGLNNPNNPNNPNKLCYLSQVHKRPPLCVIRCAYYQSRSLRPCLCVCLLYGSHNVSACIYV